MKLTLILAGSHTSCLSTKEIWQQACGKYHINIEVFDLNDSNGKKTAKRLNLKSFPALIVDEKIIAVGHPDKQAAEKIISDMI
jgi:hypothetical protein